MQSAVGDPHTSRGPRLPRPPASGNDLPTPRAERSRMIFPAACLTAAFQPETKTIPQAAKRPLQRDPSPPRAARQQTAPPRRGGVSRRGGGLRSPQRPASPCHTPQRRPRPRRGGSLCTGGPPRRGASRARRVQTCCVLPGTPTRSENTSPAGVSAVAGALALAPARSAPHAAHRDRRGKPRASRAQARLGAHLNNNNKNLNKLKNTHTYKTGVSGRPLCGGKSQRDWGAGEEDGARTEAGTPAGERPACQP